MDGEGDLIARLAETFDPGEVKFKPAVISGNRAMALAYVDARVIQDRLDDVLTPAGWQDTYEVLADGSVTCKLSLKIGDEWVTKMDVGGPSEQPDGGDRMKAAFSDALKRAAVKFGIGRYLYRLPAQWVDYDASKRQFVKNPVLPQKSKKPSRDGKKDSDAKATGRKILEAAKSFESLALAWRTLPKAMQEECQDIKDAMKAKLKETANAQS